VEATVVDESNQLAAVAVMFQTFILEVLDLNLD